MEKKVRIGFITSNLSRDLSGGRMYSQIILDSLKICGGDVVVFSLRRDKSFDANNSYIYLDKTAGRVNTFFLNFSGYSQGLRPLNVKDILGLIKEKQLSIIWIDGSQFGRIAKAIKLKYPEVRVVTSFQNIEYILRRGIKNNRILNYISSFSDYYNEYCALKYSDAATMITLNDKNIAKKKFKYSCGIEVLPICYHKAMDNNFVCDNVTFSNYVLFVGSNYGPNLEAIHYIDTMIADYINCQVVVIGTGLADATLKLKSKNIFVLGRVEDLTSYYLNAKCVIAPIFHGGGMKVKIGEALSFGKYVLGTSEAFVGYESILSMDYMLLANSANEYIDFINNHNFSKDSSEIRDNFFSIFGFEVFRSKISAVIG